MKRVNKEETRVVVKVAEEHVFPTQWGWALILDVNHVVFLRPWQVDVNYFGCEVLIEKTYFKPKEWGNFPSFGENPDNLIWDKWVAAAKAQDNLINEDGAPRNRVHWTK